MSSSLTEADLHALKCMPDKWFKASDLPFTIRCPRYRCERLTEKGVLDSRVIGEYPHFVSEWRKKSEGEQHNQ